jgi:hypothetical protein
MLFELLTKTFSDNCKTLYEVIQKESKYGLENQDECSHHGHEVVLIQVLFNVENSTLLMWVNLDWKIANLNISWDVLGWDVDP